MALMRARLQCTDALGTAQLVDISAGGICGRDPSVEIVLDHPTISRRHARFSLRGSELEIQDLGSINGTWVNDRMLDNRPCLIADGDQIRLGHLHLRLHLTPASDSRPIPLAKPPGSLHQTMHAGKEPGRVDRSLLLASLAQRRMLVDRPPAINGYEFGQVIVPAQSVGGDFIHWGRGSDGRHALVIGDVCGKGVAAAMYMAFVSGQLFEVVPACASASAILARVNHVLHQVLEPGFFVTAMALMLDTDKHVAELACAGHAPPLLKRSDGSVTEVRIDSGVALGPQSQADLGVAEVHLQEGEMLMMTTDGVEEAHNGAGVELGRAGVIEAIRTAAGAVDAARRLRLVATEHANKAVQHDDLTAVAIERCTYKQQ